MLYSSGVEKSGDLENHSYHYKFFRSNKMIFVCRFHNFLFLWWFGPLGFGRPLGLSDKWAPSEPLSIRRRGGSPTTRPPAQISHLPPVWVGRWGSSQHLHPKAAFSRFPKTTNHSPLSNLHILPRTTLLRNHSRHDHPRHFFSMMGGRGSSVCGTNVSPILVNAANDSIGTTI